MFEAGSIVIAHLVNPTEKFWGVLHGLDAAGVVLRGISVSSFDDWMRQVATEDEPSLGLATMYLPLFRVERIFLDEQIGEVESYCQKFQRRVGMSVGEYLGLEPSTEIPS